MKKYNKKNQPRDNKLQQNRKPFSEKLPCPKFLAEVQIGRVDAITIPRAEYDELVNNAHVVNVVEELCECSGDYAAAKFLRHIIKKSSTGMTDVAPYMNTLVTLDRAKYDGLNQATGLLNAIIRVSQRPHDYDLNNMLEMLFCVDEKVDNG